MYKNILLYEIIVLDYIFAIFIIIPVFLKNKNYQNIDIKLIKFFIWLILGLPFFLIFFFKFSFFFNNIYIFIFFLFINTASILIYYEKIEQILKKKKFKKYYWNNRFNFYHITVYIIFLILQTILFF